MKLNVKGQAIPGAFSVIPIDAKSIWVSVTSSGHCDEWKEQSYKRPIYQQEPEVIGNGISSTSSSSEKKLSRQVTSDGTVKSLIASTPLSSKINPKVRLSTRILDRIAKEWNGFFLPRDSSPQKVSGFMSGASEHDRARDSSEGAK